MSACVRFHVEGFEVRSPGFFLLLKGSKFGRTPPTPHNPLPPVTGLVACALIKVEGFEFWVRVLDSMSKGSSFGRMNAFLKSKGSRFGRLGPS